MTNLAENLAEIFIDEADDYDEMESDVVEISSRQRESLAENFNDELEAWARHSLGLNGFGDY